MDRTISRFGGHTFCMVPVVVTYTRRHVSVIDDNHNAPIPSELQRINGLHKFALYSTGSIYDTQSQSSLEDAFAFLSSSSCSYLSVPSIPNSTPHPPPKVTNLQTMNS